MALLWMDSFDLGLESYNYPLVSTLYPTASTSYGRGGTKGVYLGDSPNDYLDRYVANTDATIVVGFAMNHRATPTANDVLLYLYDGSTPQLNIRWVTGDKFRVCLGTSTTAICESAVNTWPYQEWFYFEFKALISNTVGTVELRVNGTSVCSATSVDTQDSANAYVDRFRIAHTVSGYIHQIWIDDLYVLNGVSAGTPANNDFLGDISVKALLPNGNGNSSGMTGSDGNSTDNYLLVDEDPVVTADYVESDTQGTKDTYAMETLSDTNVSVLGVQTSIVQAKDDSGTKYLRTVLRTESTDYVGTSRALSETYTVENDIWDENPNTSVAWTTTQIGAVEVGQEVRDS